MSIWSGSSSTCVSSSTSANRALLPPRARTGAPSTANAMPPSANQRGSVPFLGQGNWVKPRGAAKAKTPYAGKGNLPKALCKPLRPTLEELGLPFPLVCSLKSEAILIQEHTLDASLIPNMGMLLPKDGMAYGRRLCLQENIAFPTAADWQC